MDKEKKIDFEVFKRSIKSMMAKPVDLDMIHDLYVYFKEDIGYYRIGISEFIENYFSDWTLDTHDNCLKSKLITKK